MSTLRGFFRFLDKTGRVHNPAIKAVKTPRLPESIPRPLDKDDARSVIEKIAEFYDQQVEAEVKGLTSMIEPIMIAIMGVIVGGIVLAVFLPIFKLQEKLSGG